MGISMVFGLVALLGVLMLFAGGAIAISSAAKHRSGRPGLILAGIGLLIAVIFFAMSTGVVEIGPDEVGVVFQRIGGDPNTNSLWPSPLGPGIHIIVPIINDVTIYSTRSQTYTMAKNFNEGNVQGDDSVTARTKDGQQTYIDVTITYNIDPAKANILHLKWQDRYQDELVRPRARAAVYSIVGDYLVDELFAGGKNVEIENIVSKNLGPDFQDNGLRLTNVQVRQITFSDAFNNSVEQKQVAQQQAEQAQQEADRKRTLAKGDADAAVTGADGAAQANIAKAKGDAEAITVRAEADAKALALISEQLLKDPQLIEWRYIEKLASNISLILLPSNSPFLFNSQNLMSGTGLPASPTPDIGVPVTLTPEPTATPS